jgi:hypothetical protein
LKDRAPLLADDVRRLIDGQSGAALKAVILDLFGVMIGSKAVSCIGAWPSTAPMRNALSGGSTGSG